VCKVAYIDREFWVHSVQRTQMNFTKHSHYLKSRNEKNTHERHKSTRTPTSAKRNKSAKMMNCVVVTGFHGCSV
jgi:hypothetical protein